MDEKDIVKEIKDKVDAIKVEGEGKVSKEVFDKAIFDVNQKLAAYEASKPTNINDKANEFAKMLKDRKEIKNLTQNGAGYVQVISEIITTMTEVGKILPKVRTFYGDNAQVNIPILVPSMARPAKGAQGKSDFASDSTAVFGSTELTPFPFHADVPVDRLAINTTSIQSSLNQVYQDGFGEGFEYSIINGAGSDSYDFTGIFNSTFITSVSGAYSSHIKTSSVVGGLAWGDLRSIAAGIKAKARGNEILGLLINGDVIESLVTSSGASCATEIEYVNKGTVNGVPVITMTTIPSTLTTGSYIACACDLSKYGVAMVRDVSIEQNKVVGDANIHMESYVYANGKPLVKDSFYFLKTK